MLPDLLGFFCNVIPTKLFADRGSSRLFANILVSSTSKFTNILEQIACDLITVLLYSYMLLFLHARGFFSRFVLWRKYKVQVIAHVGRKSAVVLSGIMEASYSRFFIGQGFDRSRGSSR